MAIKGKRGLKVERFVNIFHKYIKDLQEEIFGKYSLCKHQSSFGYPYSCCLTLSSVCVGGAGWNKV